MRLDSCSQIVQRNVIALILAPVRSVRVFAENGAATLRLMVGGLKLFFPVGDQLENVLAIRVTSRFALGLDAGDQFRKRGILIFGDAYAQSGHRFLHGV